LHRDAEAIVQATIEDVYLSRQKPLVQHVCVEVLRRCRNAGVSPPHPNTVRSRIRHLADNVQLHRREGSGSVSIVEMVAPISLDLQGIISIYIHV
jgi:putative transposase